MVDSCSSVHPDGKCHRLAMPGQSYDGEPLCLLVLTVAPAMLPQASALIKVA